jgi:L-asparaginase
MFEDRTDLVDPSRVERPRIWCVETGGTIASARSEEGKRPVVALPAMVRTHLRSVGEMAELVFPAVGTPAHFGRLLDSSDAQPEDWARLAEVVFQALGSPIDGVVITTGTDTMAYAAAALDLMIEAPSTAIVLTGAQRIVGDRGSDAEHNLRSAVFAAGRLSPGVYIVFGDKVIHGGMAHKASSRDLRAFEGVNGGDMGDIDLSTQEFGFRSLRLPPLAAEPKLRNQFDNGVKVEFLIPGYEPRYLRNTLADPVLHGLVIMGYGLGGMPCDGPRSLIPVIEEYANKKPIVLMTQCESGGVDLTEYAVGRRALAAGVISGDQYSIEYASFRLKWLLAQTDVVGEIRARW